MYVNVTALVLSARRSGEKDKRLALYTREHGRLWAAAVGSARPGAKLSAATEPAVEARFRLWRTGDAAGARVTGGGVENAFPGLRPEWRRMAAAQSLCEWTERLTPLAEPHPETYDLLRRCLGFLEAGDAEAVRLAFEARFLALAGYNPARDVPGLAAEPGAVELLSALAEDELTRPPAALPESIPAAYLRQQLLKFVAPLLHGPFKSSVHEENLAAYYSVHR